MSGADRNITVGKSWPRAATPCDLVPNWEGEFCSFSDWVNFASICVDTLGRRCANGGDFARARDEGTFPVRYFFEYVEPEHDAVIAELRAKLKEAQADAARYQWLRDNSVPPHNFYISVPDEFRDVHYSPQEVDAYIDEARAALVKAQVQP